MENLNENIGGKIEIEFQDWLDMMYTDKDYPEIETLETVIDYAQDTLRDYRADYTVFESKNRKMGNLNEGKKKKASAYMAELAEIDKQSAIVAMEAKINHLQEMADKKNERLKMVSEDENLSELIDSKKKKSMEREIKEIEKAKAKLEKVYEKMSGGKKKEIVDEDEEMNEYDSSTQMIPDEKEDGTFDMSSVGMKEEEIDEAHCNTEEDDTNSMNEEFLRMQKLAGVISEEEYKKKLNEEVSPEIAADKAIKTLADKLEKSPKLDKLAAQVAKNPKLMAQLEKSVKDAGVNVELAEDESGLDMADMKTMALNLAKKSKSVNEKQEYLDDEDGTLDVGLTLASFVGGGSLGAAFGSTILAAAPAVASVFAGPALVGALAGVALFTLVKKAYLADKNAGLY